jgi:hypothetical protein
MSRPKLDMKPRSAVKGLADWIGKGCDAVAVMVVRADDTVFWVHPACAPSDAAELVRRELGRMVLDTTTERLEERAKVKVREMQRAVVANAADAAAGGRAGVGSRRRAAAGAR